MNYMNVYVNVCEWLSLLFGLWLGIGFAHWLCRLPHQVLVGARDPDREPLTDPGEQGFIWNVGLLVVASFGGAGILMIIGATIRAAGAAFMKLFG
jgi:hypothetical protein